MESLHRSYKFTGDDLEGFNYRGTETWTRLKTNATLLANSAIAPIPAWLEETNGAFPQTEWTNWFSTATPIARTVDNTFALIISPRAKPPRPGEIITDQPAAIRYLSIQAASFKSILEAMHVHRALIVLLKRGDPIISRIKCTINSQDNCLVYTLRVDHTMTHQAAITITYFPPIPGATGGPQGSMTNALILGYDDVDKGSFIKVLESCRENIFSPFTLIKAFLHVERNRRFEEVSKLITKFRDIMANYGNASTGRDAAIHNKQDPKGLIPLYMDVCVFKNRLAAWKTQIGELRGYAGDFRLRKSARLQADIEPSDYLTSLTDEYDGRMSRCDMVLQGASLAFQMETAHLSRLDALSALRDGKQMKAVAVLTMIFLPGTFIATVLAVPEFDALKTTKKVEPWAWYLIMFLPLTAVVLLAYFAWINLAISKTQKDIQAMV